ncbi:MAG: hypothetical protein JOZ72_09605 [Alphaproteobacteria bacterium]|nr:hypothetical protein [Alphaproteobacteria bacterium]
MSGDSAEPRHRRHWSDTAIAVAALFVSAVSLWVGIRTESANEQLVAASTWPFLQMGVDNSTPEGVPFLKFQVVNSGVGPARIESFELFWKGKPFASSKQLLHACCGFKSRGGPIKPLGDQHTRLLTGTVQGIVLRSGESEAFIMYALNQDNMTEWNALDRARRDITFRVCYCSVLNECWRNTLYSDLAHPGQLRPEVKVCPVPAVAYTN